MATLKNLYKAEVNSITLLSLFAEQKATNSFCQEQTPSVYKILDDQNSPSICGKGSGRKSGKIFVALTQQYYLRNYAVNTGMLFLCYRVLAYVKFV